VLCIDDRPQLLELRKATLEAQGYCVKIASSSYMAMKMLDETSLDAVLLEYEEEGMDGSRSLPYQATVSQLADHPAFRVLRDARANAVVGG
jgi:DNA-binding response OmpR family regulator